MRTTNLILLILLFSLIAVSPVSAQIEVIRGVDRVIQATEARETRAEKGRKISAEQRRLEEDTAQNLEESRRKPDTVVRERFSEDARLSNNPWARVRQKQSELRIEIFIAESCKKCTKMEQYLNDVGVPYRRHFLERGSDAEQMYLSQVGRGVIPVTRINGRLVRGYQPEEVRKIILEEKKFLRRIE